MIVEMVQANLPGANEVLEDFEDVGPTGPGVDSAFRPGTSIAQSKKAKQKKNKKTSESRLRKKSSSSSAEPHDTLPSTTRQQRMFTRGIVSTAGALIKKEEMRQSQRVQSNDNEF